MVPPTQKDWCFNWSSSEQVNKEEEVKNLKSQIKTIKDRSKPAEELDWKHPPPSTQRKKKT
jgi:hypothetical protein